MQHSAIYWLRRNLFSSLAQTVLTLLLLTLILFVGSKLVRWGITDAVFAGGVTECRAAAGACWAVIGEKYRPILFGLYPYEEQWRPTLCMVIWFASVVLSLSPACWHSRFLW